MAASSHLRRGYAASRFAPSISLAYVAGIPLRPGLSWSRTQSHDHGEIPMTRRVVAAALAGALLLTSLLVTGSSATTPLSLPASMAAVGDSITQAASSGGSLGTDYPQNSWATGTNATVNSHYQRLLALGAPLSGSTYNLSVSGAKMADLNAQMLNVVGVHPDYLTVLIGGNDLCTSTLAAMTSVQAIHDQFQTAMTTLMAGSPNTNVYVVSIPDVYQLWSLFHNNWYARFIWSVGNVCQSLLANPTSTQSTDVQRRADVRQRNVDYNAQLGAVCGSAAFANHCHFDNGAIFGVQFTSSDVAGDYFHPSIAGQAKLASVSWGAGYSWASTPPTNAPPAASFTTSCAYLTCSFTDTSTDSDGSIVAWSWMFGDGPTSTSSAENPSHTFAAAGSYTVGLIVTDNGGATSSTSATLTLVAPPAQDMWISGLAGSSASTARRSWTATVTITVAGSPSAPGAGVTVTGAWSGGTSGSGTCITDGSSSCSVTSASMSTKKASATFSVTSLAEAGWTYLPASNANSSFLVLKP